MISETMLAEWADEQEKQYRHPTLDKKLTRARLVGEARATVRARKEGVRVPGLLYCESATGTLVFERIAGQALKHVVDAEGASPRVLGLLRELISPGHRVAHLVPALGEFAQLDCHMGYALLAQHALGAGYPQLGLGPGQL